MQRDRDAAEIAKGVGDPKLAAARIKELEDRIRLNVQSRGVAADDQALNLTRRHQLEQELIPAARDALSRCNETCTAVDPLRHVIGGGAEPIEPSDGPAPDAKCEPCEAPADEFTRLEEERRQLTKAMDGLDREIGQLEAEKAKDQQGIDELTELGRQGNSPERRRIAGEMIERARQRIADNDAALKAKRGARDNAGSAARRSISGCRSCVTRSTSATAPVR